MISVNMVEANVYQVVVQSDVETTHRVSMSQAYYRQLCDMTVTHEFVLIEAFKFLLLREPNTSILSAFDLADINRYFPEFEAEIRAQLGAR